MVFENPNVSTVLLGATKPSQLDENLGALDVAVKMTEQDMNDVEAILNNRPEVYSGYGGGGWQRRIETLN